MPFSAVTCLSYTGTTSLGGVLNLYSDTDSYTTAFQTNINLSAITGNECPYYINNVPDGTTQIRIFDNGTGCYCDIPIQSNIFVFLVIWILPHIVRVLLVELLLET